MSKYKNLLAVLVIVAMLASGLTLASCRRQQAEPEHLGFFETEFREIQVDHGITCGEDGNGADVTFYSDTSGDQFLWDTSAEALVITGSDGQDALQVADGDLDVVDDVDIDGDLDVNGTANLDNIDIDGTANFADTVTFSKSGNGITSTPGCDIAWQGYAAFGDATADGLTAGTDEDVFIEGNLEIDSTLYADGAIDADSTANFADTVTFGKSGTGITSTPGCDIAWQGYAAFGDATADGLTAGTDEDVFVEGNVEVDGTLYADGAIDADGGANVASGLVADTLEVNGTVTLQNDETIKNDVDGTISATVASSGYFNVVTGNLRVGDGSADGTINGEDAYIEGYCEIDGELELDGALDADSTANFADTVTFSKSGNGITSTPGCDIAWQGYTAFGDATADGLTAGTDEDVFIEGNLEVDSTAYFDGAIDADGDLDVDGTSNLDEVDIDGVTNLVVGTEHIGIPSVVSTAITYTAATGGSGTVATIADGEIWFIHDILVNCTTEFTATAGDDETLKIGDGNDDDGFLTLDHTDLTTTYNEGVTGHAAGWLGKIEANVGVYFDPDGTDGFHNNTFIYAPSGSAETIDWIVACTGNDCTAGAATIYVIYTRIQ